MSAARPEAKAGFCVDSVRADFPVLDQEIHGKKLVYLDSAASAQKPRQVGEAMQRLYDRDYSNIHRGVHTLSERSTRLYEGVRERVRAFVGASSASEIIFVRGTTEAINLVAHSYGAQLEPGDEILISGLEHHSNIVPWQLLCERAGTVLRVVPIDERGDLQAGRVADAMSDRTRLVAIAHVSNALGTVLPVKEITALAHARGAKVLVDGAQAAPHLKVDVRDLGVDFYALSSHKAYGPTGVGCLYGKEELLETMPPFQGGGDMIKHVSFDKTVYNDLPWKFEAGTPDIGGVIGFGAAIDYLGTLDFEALQHHEESVLSYALAELVEVPGLRLIGEPQSRLGAVSFVLDGIHPHDIGTILDREGVAIRAGHHCAQPVMEFFSVPATVRASFGIYNTHEEVDRLVAAIRLCREVFG